MKKLLMIIILLLPINVIAYSDEIILGGETLGIDVTSDGVMIVGFYEIDGKFNKGNPILKQGDYILEVNNIKITSVSELTNIIEKNIDNKEVTITYRRGDSIKNTKLDLIEADGIYKTGLYVKDSVTGIGTLTYIDPITNIYGALGHEILESTSSELVEVKTGSIFKNTITSIDKSSIGNPGSKNAKFYYDTKYGNILENTKYGIFGIYDSEINIDNLIKVAEPSEVKIGSATIYTVLSDETVEEFTINITSINENSETKNMTIEITDQRLIDETGGVVQGMSGSPIVQNNKIIGAVTHVIVDNPVTGYGLFITTMLEEGEN